MKGISIIVAMDRNRTIGRDGELPWRRLPTDMANFRKVTLGHVVIMGRKTYDSIGGPLAQRTNVVISRNPELTIPGCSVVRTLKEACQTSLRDEVFVIGGSSIYEMALPVAKRLYITLVDGEFSGDTFFPEFDLSEWKLIFQIINPADRKNYVKCTFAVYERIADQEKEE